ncbi:MAG: recombinase family protein [Tissierellia bacterium]|nr:recombinase family protein [Tissierellia bacterium]
MYKNFKQNDNNYAFTYSRFSSASQDEFSIERQQKLNREFAEKHGYVVLKEYADYAISGKSSDRPQFNLMMKELEKIKPSAVIVWKDNRLSRDLVKSIKIKSYLRELGCKLEYVEGISPNLDTAQGILMDNIGGVLAQYWSDESRENIISGQRQKALNCRFLGHKLLGYRKSKDNKYEIDPDTSPIVKRIFDDYINGSGTQEIANNLNNQGLRTITGGKFNVNGIYKTLKNDKYTGIYRYKDIEIEGGMPVIIDKEKFDKAQKILKSNQRPKRSYKPSNYHRYWLSGKLYCGHCGGVLHGTSGTSKTGNTHYYYVCANQRKHKCNKKYVRASFIETIVKDILYDLLHDDENLASLAVDAHTYYRKYYKESQYLESLQSKLKHTEKSLQNLLKAVELGVFNETTQEAMLKREEEKKSLLKAIKIEEAKQKMTETEHSIKEYIKKFSKTDLDNAELRDSVLDYFIDKIYIYDDKLVIIGNYTGDDDIELTFDEYEDVMETGGKGFAPFSYDSTTTI